MFRTILAVGALLTLTACPLPRDARGTTDDVRGAILKVGLLAEEIPAQDADAVARVAERLDAEAQLVRGNVHVLLKELERGELHLLAGGIPRNTPLSGDAGLTNAIGHITIGPDRTERVLLVRKGENRFLFEVNRAIRALTREARP